MTEHLWYYIQHTLRIWSPSSNPSFAAGLSSRTPATNMPTSLPPASRRPTLSPFLNFTSFMLGLEIKNVFRLESCVCVCVYFYSIHAYIYTKSVWVIETDDMHKICLLLQLEDVILWLPSIAYQLYHYTTDSSAALKNNKKPQLTLLLEQSLSYVNTVF